jgi:hypothetical protein
MTYYNMFNNPTAAQNDDIDIVNGALALARTLRDDDAIWPRAWSRTPFLEGLAETIIQASEQMNHTAASREVRNFGFYLTDTHRDDLDDLICDYLSTAQKLVEEYDA